jgi:putative endonuclease
MSGHVYILESQTYSRFYIGASECPEKRLIGHNSNNTISTRNKGPWKIVFQKEYPSIKEAKSIEKKLKKLKSRKILEKIIQQRDIKISA